MDERALRERIVWRGERFSVGLSGLPGLHLIVEEEKLVSTHLSCLSSASSSSSIRDGAGSQYT